MKGLLAEGGSQLWLKATPSAGKGRGPHGFLHFGVVFGEKQGVRSCISGKVKAPELFLD